jgi:hypothetical protein
VFTGGRQGRRTAISKWLWLLPHSHHTWGNDGKSTDQIAVVILECFRDYLSLGCGGKPEQAGEYDAAVHPILAEQQFTKIFVRR